MREIAHGTLFNLRWLTKKYYKKKGFSPLDISHWPPYNKTSIKRMLLYTTDKKSDALFLKDSKENPYAIVIIKDWERVVGVNQGYQVERLKGILKHENIEINNLKFILVSRSGFSESIKRFARKQDIELKTEADMTYEYPKLGEIVKRQRMAQKIAAEKAKVESKEIEAELEEVELEEELSKDNLDVLLSPKKEDEVEESFRKSKSG